MEVKTKTIKNVKKASKKLDNTFNESLLSEMSEPEMKVYCVNNRYFFSKFGLEFYCEKNNIPVSSAYTIEYYRTFACRTDVIKIKGKYYAAIDEDGYGVYDPEKSNYINGYIWNFEYGSLRAEYQLLKNLDIELENDIYGNSDENKCLIKKSQLFYSKK